MYPGVSKTGKNYLYRLNFASPFKFNRRGHEYNQTCYQRINAVAMINVQRDIKTKNRQGEK